MTVNPNFLFSTVGNKCELRDGKMELMKTLVVTYIPTISSVKQRSILVGLKVPLFHKKNGAKSAEFANTVF